MIPSLSVVQTVPSRRRNDAPALSSPPNPIEPSMSPATNHMNPTGTSTSRRPRCVDDAVDHRDEHERLADRVSADQPSRATEQVRDRGARKRFGLSRPASGVTTPCRSASASLPRATSNRSRNAISPAIADGDDGSIRIFPSQSMVMKPKVRIDPVVDDREVEAVALRDGRQ